MSSKQFCAGTVKDRGQDRQCHNRVGSNQIFCHHHRGQSINTSHSGIATEHTPPQSPVDLQSTHATTHEATPLKANQQSITNGNISTRCAVFSANLEELTLVNMDCEKKIDLLFGELEEAADVLGSLEDMKLSLLNSKAWQDWLEEMNGSYISEQPLRPQKNFHEILTEAQSILTKKIKATKFCSFRNLLRENIGFTAPHDQQEKLRALRPDIVVVTQEHLRSNPPVYGEFRCVMEHKRGIKVMQNSTAIQESLVRSLQTFNDNFLRHYLYSVFVAGTKLRLFRLHRGGIVYYDADVDIENNPETFMKFVAWLSFASSEQLGYGKDFDSIGGVRFQCEWNNPSRRPKAEVLDSRGTTVWTVKCPEQFSLNDLKTTTLDESLAQLNLDDKTPRILETQRAILKMQWAYETRTTTEADFLRDISNMPGVPKLIAECTGASTKDFSDPDSGTERIPLIANHTPTISITSSAY